MYVAKTNMGLRAVARCDELGGGVFSELPSALLRPYLTPSHRQALTALEGWMTAAGMTVRLDPMGNMIGRYEGAAPGAPIVLIGSHIDTVPDGGRYDGALGVMLGVEVVDALNRRGVRLPFAIEVIAFGDEEGSRFPASMLCSRAIAEDIDALALDLVDEAGLSVADALRAFGLDPSASASARYAPGQVIAYLEAHIEQGPILETENLPIGVVTGIAAQRRLRGKFRGMAGHAGTTPMALRRDALAGAGEAVLAVERICRAGGGDLVGTVGKLQASTGAFNVVVGEAEVFIDIRASDRVQRDVAVEAVRVELIRIAASRSLDLDLIDVQDLPGCPCDDAIIRRFEAAVEAVGVRPMRLMSGAGHDAMAVAPLCPVGMLFIRCQGGISHNAAEQVTVEDTDYAARALLAFLEDLGAQT